MEEKRISLSEEQDDMSTCHVEYKPPPFKGLSFQYDSDPFVQHGLHSLIRKEAENQYGTVPILGDCYKSTNPCGPEIWLESKEYCNLSDVLKYKETEKNVNEMKREAAFFDAELYNSVLTPEGALTGISGDSEYYERMKDNTVPLECYMSDKSYNLLHKNKNEEITRPEKVENLNQLSYSVKSSNPRADRVKQKMRARLEKRNK